MKIDDKLLTQAFINNNNRFMESISSDVESHNFSRRFEKKMNHLISADKKYGGNIWIERFVRFSAKAAVIILCLITMNFVSVKAFGFNFWNVIIEKTGEFLNINFEKPKDDITGVISRKLRLVNIPEGYEQLEYYEAENMFVQCFMSDSGTITYTECPISETADVNIASGAEKNKQLGNYRVSYITVEESITAFFIDDEYYHIVEIQGANANEEFASKIIEELEER